MRLGTATGRCCTWLLYDTTEALPGDPGRASALGGLFTSSAGQPCKTPVQDRFPGSQ